MRIKAHSKKTKTGDDNLIPLINIVFLMLIFFMVAGNISKADAVSIAPPEALNAAPPLPPEQTVYILADGSLLLNDTPIEVAALATALGTLPLDTTPIAIKADKHAHAKNLDTVIDTLQTLGVAKITLFAVALPRKGQH